MPFVKSFSRAVYSEEKNKNLSESFLHLLLSVPGQCRGIPTPGYATCSKCIRFVERIKREHLYHTFQSHRRNIAANSQVNRNGYPYFHRKFASYGTVNGRIRTVSFDLSSCTIFYKVNFQIQ
jgi:hypothetical protein